MRVAVTGTPGTGKTTAVDLLASGSFDVDLDVVHLNDVIAEAGLFDSVDERRDSRVADLEAVREYLAGRDDVVIESHLAHYLDADRVVVLRAAPEVIEQRLEQRGEAPESVAENAESEALDVILGETVQRHDDDRIYEIDTTDLSPEAVAAAITDVISGEREPSYGTVDFSEYLLP